MFVFLTSPTIGQVLVNPDLITAVTSGHGETIVYFCGSEDDCIKVKESVDEVYMILCDSERRARK